MGGETTRQVVEMAIFYYYSLGSNDIIVDLRIFRTRGCWSSLSSLSIYSLTDSYIFISSSVSLSIIDRFQILFRFTGSSHKNDLEKEQGL